MITSRDNRKLKDIRRLLQSKDDDRALLEGPHLVGEAINAGLALELVLATPEFLERTEGSSIVERLAAPPIEVEGRLLDELADADSPRGLLAVCQMRRGGVEGIPTQVDGLYVYVAALQDPGNLGALARVAEAAGAAGLVLGPGSAHPNHPRALRASAGSLLRLPVAIRVGIEELQRHLAPLSPAWLALDARGEETLTAGRRTAAIVLLCGSEGGGLPADVLAVADETVRIPMEPPVESLNVVTAAAIALFELRRQRSAR